MEMARSCDSGLPRTQHNPVLPHNGAYVPAPHKRRGFDGLAVLVQEVLSATARWAPVRVPRRKRGWGC